ncbi:transposase [Streptomyces sp. NPDC020379]|uniref:transposase n=1 Tax=Streptomyces sp. NPDC020379 TaxID=3365071 RepID=UPI0037969501
MLFQRVAPPTEVNRPQGGGRRRAGDRETPAAIVFVATSGCTWRQSPPVFGPAWPTVHRRFAQWSRERVWARLHRVILDEQGRALPCLHRIAAALINYRRLTTQTTATRIYGDIACRSPAG